MRREAIQGALITITIVLGIPLLRSKDARETARLIVLPVKSLFFVQKFSSNSIEWLGGEL